MVVSRLPSVMLFEKQCTSIITVGSTDARACMCGADRPRQWCIQWGPTCHGPLVGPLCADDASVCMYFSVL